jgi:hypothetical protein
LLQFQHSPLILALLNSLIGQVQELTDVFRDIITKRSPYDAGTDQLNAIGRIVGQVRTVVGFDSMIWLTPDKDLHGVDQAPVWVENAPLAGNLIADNEWFKKLIAAKIARNHTRFASAPEIQEFARRAFGIEISFRVVSTMTVQIIVPDNTEYNVKEALGRYDSNDTTENAYLLPFAAGVQVSEVVTFSEYYASL